MIWLFPLKDDDAHVLSRGFLSLHARIAVIQPPRRIRRAILTPARDGGSSGIDDGERSATRPTLTRDRAYDRNAISTAATSSSTPAAGSSLRTGAVWPASHVSCAARLRCAGPAVS